MMKQMWRWMMGWNSRDHSDNLLWDGKMKENLKLLITTTPTLVGCLMPPLWLALGN